jgi:hypothetical protein
VKLHKLGTWALVVGLSLPVGAEARPGAISGYVRDAAGEPQILATVEILGSANRALTVFTDGAGHYAATGLLPGFYNLRVSAPSFLPVLREKIGLRPGASINVNVTLSTLLNVMQLGPIRTLPDDDDWKWTLRSVANRPVLRVFDDPAMPEDTGTKITFSDGETPGQDQDQDLSGTLSFVAGSADAGYGSGSDMSTGFTLDRSIFSDGHLAFSGNVGYGDGLPAAVVRAGYSHQLDDGSQPTLGLTVRRFAPSDPTLHNAALQALALSMGDDFTVGDVLELKFGSELQTIQFLGHVNAVRPYGTADLHLSPNTVLEYCYTSSRPDPRAETGFDSAPADFSEANPRVSVLDYEAKVENAHHEEVNLSRRLGGNNNLQVAVFTDRVSNPALTGAGEVTAAGGFLLPDMASETFSYTGNPLDTGGVRVVLQHKFASDLTATLDYAFGGALDLSKPDVLLQDAQGYISTVRRHAVAAKLSGTLPHTHTRWIASYRWVNGSAITPVDMFNASAGQSDPFFNLFIRQPLPSVGIFSGHMEAIIDLRNLLAQGYIPVLGQDGQTVYLVQSARTIRGGVAFTF